MKNLFTYLFFFSTFIFSGQINLENSYNNGHIKRVNLEYSGEKYYLLKNNSNELLFYNSDHTLWKTIILPISGGSQLAPNKIFHVSESLINPDTNLEVIFGYYNNSTISYETKIISENLTDILTIPNCFSASISKIQGFPDKLITMNITNNPANSISKVYSFPSLVLENTYSFGEIKRIKLENSGEKYYAVDKTNKQVKLFNSDHTLWKTINLTMPTEAVLREVSILSENQINVDNLIEVGYTYYIETSSFNYTYTSKIINETNTDLLILPTIFSININVINGLDSKLIATGGSYYNASVYSIPSLLLEHSYDNQVTRIKLDSSGLEKYYGTFGIENNLLNIYNSDHTVWKTISLPVPNEDFEVGRVNSISESKIVSDGLIEVCYNYKHKYLLEEYYSSNVINENSSILLTVEDANSINIDEVNGLNTKLISNYQDMFSTYFSSKVFGLGSLSNENFENASQIKITPNPASTYLNIDSEKQLLEANFFNSVGILIYTQSLENNSKINIQQLPNGVYFLLLKDSNNNSSTHKIIISN